MRLPPSGDLSGDPVVGMTIASVAEPGGDGTLADSTAAGGLTFRVEVLVLADAEQAGCSMG